jgi:hypothetical protein
LTLDVRELVGERMHLGPQALELLLDLGALAANAFETLLVVAELLVEGLRTLREKRRRVNDVAEKRHEKTSRETVSTSLRDVSP